MEDKKEFYQFKKINNTEIDDSLQKILNLRENINVAVDKSIDKHGVLILNGYQQFITNFMSFNEKNDRLLLMHSTGVGKTITSLSSAINQMNSIGGNVFVLGFSKSVFRKELMTRPEFGFVSKEEVEYIKSIKDDIIRYKRNEDKDRLKDIKRKIMFRLSKGNDKRLFFIGYKALSSRIFIKLSKNADMDSLKSLEDIEYLLNKKWIKINDDFIQQTMYSFIICDEVHNLYNSSNMNAWGICLKFLLNSIQAKTLFLSATPVNNRPEKIVSIINLLSKDKEYKNSDIFYQRKLTETGKNIIISETKNKISFLMDRDVENYPKSKFNGEKIEGVEYIKVVQCEASEIHYNTIKELYREQSVIYNSINEIENTENLESVDDKMKEEDNVESEESEDIIQISKESNRIPLEGKYRILNDMVFPSTTTDKFGIFLKEDVITEYTNMEQDISRNLGIVYRNNSKSGYECVRDVDGDFLKEDNIHKYSSKYYTMLQLIRTIFSNDKGKLFIYHNYVQGSGTCIIKNILKRNGILEHGEHSSSTTRCSKCYRYKSEHGAECSFKPLTFIYATGYVSKYELEYKLDLFNSNANSSGENIGIILGSQAIKESYDFKAVRNIIVAYMPDNISTLIQVLGRAIRKNSHQLLEKEKRTVDINILITSLKSDKSFEHYKYAYKTRMFRQIKEINKMLIENSIDLDNNYDINYNTSNLTDSQDLYSLPFVQRPVSVKKSVSNTTWKAYYYKEEVVLCKYIIKRLLIENFPMPLSFNQISEEIFNLSSRPQPHRFKVNRDTSYISIHSIKTALYYLVFENSNKDSKNNLVEDIDYLFENVYVNVNGNQYVVKESNSLFFLTTIENYKYVSYNDYLRQTTFIHRKKLVNVNKIVNSEKNIILERNEFIESLDNIMIEEMDTFIQTIDPAIHANTVEYIIEYFNDMWLRQKKWIASDKHDCLVKLLFFYNKFNVIIFANYIDVETEEDYISFYKKGLIKKSKMSLTTSSDSHYKHYKNMLNSTNASIEELENIMNGYSLKYHKYYKYKDKMFPGNNGVKDFLLPIGHYFHTKIRIFSSDRVWKDSNTFNKLNELNNRFKDNRYIIGFLEKDKSGFRISFKIRLETNNNEVKDSRKIIVGSVCEHFEKEQLVKICSKLGIKLQSKEDLKKHSMCDKIKIKLIELELKARRDESNIRYFKFYWE